MVNLPQPHPWIWRQLTQYSGVEYLYVIPIPGMLFLVLKRLDYRSIPIPKTPPPRNFSGVLHFTSSVGVFVPSAATRIMMLKIQSKDDEYG